MTQNVSNTARDPVCNMEVSMTGAAGTAQRSGRSYFFCSEACREAFLQDPERYLKPKGLIRRLLDRLAGASQKEFSGKKPCCH